MGRYRAGIRITAATVLAILLAGCGSSATPPLEGVGDPTQPGGTPVTTTAATPTSTAPAVNRADPMAVYRAWWKALQDAYAAGDSTWKDLAVYGIDPILSRQRNQILALRKQRIVQRTTFTLSPHIVSRGDEVTEIADCVRGPAGTYHDIETNQPRAPKGYRNDVSTQDPVQVLLRRQGGFWYVAAATNQGVQPC